MTTTPSKSPDFKKMNLDHKESCIVNDSILEPYYTAKIPTLSKVKRSLPKVERVEKSKSLKKIAIKEFMPSKIWEDVERVYKLEFKLGKGTYGEVVGATCRFTRDNVAIKHVSLHFESEYEIIKLLREIMVNQGMLTCPRAQSSLYFPKLIDIIVPSNQEADDLKDIFLVFEKEPMDLKSYILA